MAERVDVGGVSVVLDPARGAYFPGESVLVLALRREPSLFDDWDAEDVRTRVDELIGRYGPETLVVLTRGSGELPQFVLEALRVGDGGLASAIVGTVRFSILPSETDLVEVVVWDNSGGLFRVEENRIWVPWMIDEPGASEVPTPTPVGGG